MSTGFTVLLEPEHDYEWTARCEMCGVEHELILRFIPTAERGNIHFTLELRNPTLQLYAGHTDSIIE